MFALFHHQKCPQRFENPVILPPMARVASLTLSGSESTRPMSDSSPLSVLLSLLTDITLKPQRKETAFSWINQVNLTTAHLLPFGL